MVRKTSVVYLKLARYCTKSINISNYLAGNVSTSLGKNKKNRNEL